MFLLFSFLAQSQTVDFSFAPSNGAFCVPAPVQFTSTASGIPLGYVWTFGNNSLSSAANPSTTYQTAGSYTVRLVVVYETGPVTVEKTVVIHPAADISLTADRNYICRPGTINFSVTGITGTGSYVWNFGDGTTTTTTGNATAHAYATYNGFTAAVKATNAAGCSDSATIQVRVARPDFNVQVAPRDGCIPVNTSFNATVDLPAGSAVSTYAWNFGDGSPTVTTATGTTNHTYTNVGNFGPSLTITTTDGCTNSGTFTWIAFGTPPTTPTAYLTRDTICGSDSLVLVAKAGNANQYNWVFGDGTTAAVQDTLVKHKFRTLGAKNISVTPSYNGCNGTTINLNAFVRGVLASYGFNNTCSNKQTFTFSDSSLGNVSTRSWSFGDGSTAGNNSPVSHTYGLPGQYGSRLIVYDSLSSCADTASQLVYYAAPMLVTSDSVLCRRGELFLSIKDNYANPDALYTWAIAGDNYGPINSAAVGWRVNNLGVHYNYVVIDNGPGYCTDTIRQAYPVRVRGIKMDFDMPESICQRDSLQVTNHAEPYYPQDTVRTWYWNFGNRPENDTSYQPRPYSYPNSWTYDVVSYGVDKNGCKDSLLKKIVVHPTPFLKIFPAVDTVCLGQTAMLYAFHSDPIRWQPASLMDCQTCDTILVSPGATTSLIASSTSDKGCYHADTALLRVFTPFTATVAFTDTAICLHDSIRLQVYPTDKTVRWTLAPGLSAGNIHNPIVSPPQTTRYQALLTDSAGCFQNTVEIQVGITPLPSVDAGPARTYPYNSTFQFSPIYSPDVVRYRWTPGILLNCDTCAFPNGRNEVSQTYYVSVTSDSGCVAMDSVRILVDCKDAYLLMPTAFTPDNNGLNDYYFPMTRGVSRIRNFMIYNRSGQLVYKAGNFAPNDRRFGWDGRFNGNPQGTGAYVYMLEAECDAGQVLNRKGSFMLLK